MTWTWWMTLLAIFVVLVLIGCIPVGVDARYSAEGVFLSAKIGPFLLQLLPQKPKKKKKKRYETPFGTFTYCDVPAEAFPLELILVQEGDYFYRIASPEKAVCDKLYTMSPTANIKELYALLADDLRIDMDALKKLDQSKLAQLSGKYHSTNVKKLCSLIRRL